MQLHQIRPIHKRKKEKRVGRGGKRGTYSGRGIKGQRARAGRKLKPIIRDLLKRYPKLRGYKFGIRGDKNLAIVNLASLEKIFSDGEKVSPQTLIEKKIIRKIKGRIPLVKVLGRGEIAKKLIFENCLFSKKAREKIKKAGGNIKD